MKHIKERNIFLSESVDILYKEISLDDNITINQGKREEFSKQEIKFIRRNNLFNTLLGRKFTVESNNSLLRIKVGINKFIYIIKYTDEWYIVQAFHLGKIYKCDTFDGVKQCITKEKLL